MIALVDYGAGNLTSVRKALAALDARFWTPASASDIDRATGVIVPGVGHFSSTAALDAGWRAAIRAAIERSVPLLGICVGLQWLFEGSTEAPEVPGLGVIRGQCELLGPHEQAGTAADGDGRLPSATDVRRPAPDDRLATRLKVPHVGWNSLSFPRASRLFAGVPEGAQVYFTHSYAAPVVSATAATTTYGTTFSAAVEEGVVSGVQFHPEKSGDVGLSILVNWLRLV